MQVITAGTRDFPLLSLVLALLFRNGLYCGHTDTLFIEKPIARRGNTAMSHLPGSVEVFCSYVHADESWRDELEKHLC